MRTLARISLFASSLIAAVVSVGAFGAALTPGNLVVYRVGDGSAALTSAATAVFLDEYTTAGTLVQTIPMPTAVSGSNRILTAAGTSTSEGLLTRSADGNYILLSGYDAATGTAGVAATTSAAVNRVVGRVDGSGSVDTSTALNVAFSGGNIRGATSSNGVNIWASGSVSGPQYATFGTTGSTTVSTTTLNLRAIAVFAGQLYVSASSGTTRVATVGTGLPTTSGNTITNLPGFPTTGSPYQFAFADLSGAEPGLDTLYVCDDAAGIQKYTLASGVWTLTGAIAASCRGLTLLKSGANAELYVTRANLTSANQLVRYVDDGSTFSSLTPFVVTTAGANTVFRGVALAPMPDLTASVSGPAGGTVGVNYDYTITVANSGTAAVSGVTLNFTLPSGVSFVSASGAGFGSSQASGVVSFTGGTIAGSSQATLTVTVTPTSPGTVTVSPGAGVADVGNTIIESDETNNSTTQTVVTNVVAAAADLTVSITAPANAAVSTNYDYTITVANGGGSAASPVRVDFALPAGVAYVSASGGGGFSGALNGSTVEFTGGTVNPGSPETLTVTVTAPAAPTTVTAPAGAVVADPLNTVVESDEGNNSSPTAASTTILAALQPDLTVSISGPSTATTYFNYDYTITAANGGSAAASNVRVDFALPSGVTFVSASGSGFAAGESGGVVSFTGGNIAVSGNVVLTVTVRAPGTPTTINVAAGAVVADPLNSIAESDEGNNASTTTVATVVSDPANLVKIHDIQGSGSTSPVVGQVKTIDGIVTGRFPGLSGFFVQEEDADADADPATSEGIFVFNTASVNSGDRVRVEGTVTEFLSTGITTTELTSATVTVISTGNPLPSAATVSLPVANSTFLERYEGMRVNFTQTLTVTDTFDLGHFGEVTLSSGGGLIQPTNVIDPNDDPASGTSSSGTSNVAAVTAAQDLNTRNQIIIEDGSTTSFPGTIAFWDGTQNTLRLGSTLDNLGGVMHHAFGSYRVLAQGTLNWTFAQRPLTPPSVGTTNVKIAGMNTLNYFNGDGLGGGFPTSRGADTLAEFNRQRAKTIQAIYQIGADVVALMEMENDGNGANSAIQDLVNGLNSVAGAGTWALINDPLGYPGFGGTIYPGATDLIKPAIIYKPAVVTPVGTAIASPDSAFSNARAPIAQTFQVNSNLQKFTVVANHFKSKGSGGTGLDADQNDGQGFFNNSRKNQATALLNFVNTTVIPAAGDPKVILMGDFNAYEQEDPMDILRAGGYAALAEGITSYSFDGQLGALDHALASSALLPRVTGADKWHINANEPTILDYNVENKATAGCSTLPCTAPDYYMATPFRASDHDPVLVGLFLASVPTAPQNLQGTAGNAQIVLTYTAPTSDGGSAITGYNASCTDGGSNTGSGSSVGAALTITVSSLVNGVTYSCTVTATNAIGTGPASTAATGLTPSTVPGAPTNVQGTAGNAQIVLTYQAPSSNGGSAITGYSASCTDGGSNTGSGNSVGAGLTITVGSLVNGVTYSCTVTAANANGAGAASSAATGLTPSTVPGAPTNVQGTAGNTQIVLTYLAPANNGGTAITGYSASCTDGGSNTGSGNSVGAGLTITVNALVNGVTYSCTVTAANANGAGPASTAVTGLTPSAVPDAPTNVQGTAGDAQATITYQAPASNGGSPITGYTATCTGGAGATGNSVGTGLTITLTGLTNGTTYTCTVVAKNANGSSVPSASVQVTPQQPSYALTVTKTGTGTGSVTSSPAGIDCGATCVGTFANGASVTLTATPTAGSSFAGWTGCDSTSSNQCTVAMTSDRNPSVTFALLNTFNVVLEGWQQVAPWVVTPASGGGTATYNATTKQLTLNLTYSGLSSGETMAHIHGPAARGANAGILINLAAGSPKTDVVTLTPTQETQLLAGQLYVNVHTANFPNGEIRGQIDNVGATVTRVLTVAKAGTGSGTVSGTAEPGTVIDCGSDCTETVPNGKVVTLTATAAAGSTFTGWSGACTGTGGCNVTMDAAKTVTATFENPPRLGNISTRMQVLTGNDVMIGGFIIGGSSNKRVAIVATGPSLTQYGITNALANPTLTLVRQSDQTVIATNDDWQTAANSATLQSLGFAPSNSLESAILIDLPPGAYTAIVAGASNGTGVGIVAVYEVDHPEIPLINIATRGQVLTGNDVMIGGFIVQGNGPQQVAIVATGPSLTQYGIANALADPTLTLVRQSDQTVIATNDDWQTAANASTLQSLGFAPSNPKEAAILITLPPGAYTAIVSGSGGGTGVGIVGVYKAN